MGSLSGYIENHSYHKHLVPLPQQLPLPLFHSRQQLEHLRWSVDRGACHFLEQPSTVSASCMHLHECTLFKMQSCSVIFYVLIVHSLDIFIIIDLWYFCSTSLSSLLLLYKPDLLCPGWPWVPVDIVSMEPNIRLTTFDPHLSPL